MKSKERGKYLFKNVVLFSIGNIGIKVISFVLVPLYTNVLTTAEYGTVDLIYTISIILVPFITLNVAEAIMRFALDKDANYGKIMSIGLICLLMSVIISLPAIPIASLFPKTNSYGFYIYLYTVSLSCSQIMLCYLRGKELLLKYSIGNILYALILAALNILFLLGFKMGIAGYLSAYIIANTLTAIYAFIAGKAYQDIKNFSFDKSLAKEMAKYSVVLIPNTFMWWIMNSSDRIMVSAMVSVAANGIYAISYKVPTMLAVLTTTFNQAWSYSAIKEDESADKEEFHNRVYGSMVSVVITIAAGLLMILKIFLKFYVSEEFYEAWKYTPYLIIGFVFMTLGNFAATFYTVNKDSKGFLFSGTSGALVNIALNFILIPVIGVYGAALATCISYVVVFVYRVFDTRKYVKLKVLNIKHLAGYAVLVAACATIYLDNPISQILLCGEFVVVLVLYNRIWLTIAKGLLAKTKGIKKQKTS